MVKSYLLDNRKNIYYDTALKEYYTLLNQNKQLIAKGVAKKSVYGQVVAVTDIKQQLSVMEKTLPTIVALFAGSEALH